MFIQSYINSDNLISRLFPLVAAGSRGVAGAPSGCQETQTDKVRCLKMSPVRSPPDLSVLHWLCFGSLTDELLHPWDHSSTALWCVFVLTLEGHSGWSSCGKCTEHQGSAESCCSCRREMCVSDLPILTSASPPSGKTLSEVKWVCDFPVFTSSRIGLFVKVHPLRFLSGIFPHENVVCCLRNLS